MSRGPSISILVAALLAGTTQAQTSSVELQIQTRTLEMGEAVTAQLVCTNTGLPQSPQCDTPDGLSLELSNPTPMSSSFTQIVNGRRSHRTTYTYQLRLTAIKEGSYTLGPIIVEADGVSYQTKAIPINVRNTQTTSEPIGDRFIYADISVAPTELYVTESYEATLTFGIRKVRINGRLYNVNLLKSVLDARSSQLSVFANGRARRSEQWLRDSAGNRHQYEIFKVPIRVRAEESGEIQVGPVFLKALYPTQIDRGGMFRTLSVTDTRTEIARADAVTITVKSPPEQGRPSDYTGAIGRFNFNVSAKPKRVEQGQPITLVLSITGSPLEGVLGPDLRAIPELASRFDYTNDELVGDLEGRAKVFRRAIFPKQVGEQTVPPISWSYFDPRQQRYVTAASPAIPIHVDPPSETATPIASLQSTEPETANTGLTVLTGGLSPNYVDASAVLANQSLAITPTWIVLLIASPLAWLTLTLTNRHRLRSLADPHGARRRKARRNALSSVSRALRHRDRTRALHGLAEAVTDYFADRFGLGAGTVTAADVRALSSTNGFEQQIASDVVAFLETCDASQYAPTQIADLSPSDAAKNVRRWIDRIEKHRP